MSANYGGSFTTNVGGVASGGNSMNFQGGNASTTSAIGGTGAGPGGGLGGNSGSPNGSVIGGGAYQTGAGARGQVQFVYTAPAFVPVVHQYTSGTGATETVPVGASFVVIQMVSGGASGGHGTSAGGGGSGAFNAIGGNWNGSSSTIAVSGGQTMTYTVGQGGAATGSGAGNPGTATTLSGTVTGGTVTMSCTAGTAGGVSTGGSGGAASYTGTAGGGSGNAANVSGGSGNLGSGAGGGAVNQGGGSGGGYGGPSTWTLIGPDSVLTWGSGGTNASSATGDINGVFPGGAGGAWLTASGTSGAGAGGLIRFYYY